MLVSDIDSFDNEEDRNELRLFEPRPCAIFFSLRRIKAQRLELIDFNAEFIRLGIDDKVLFWSNYPELLYSPSKGNFYKYSLNAKKDENTGRLTYYVQVAYRVFHYEDSFTMNVFSYHVNGRTFKKPNILALEIMNKKIVPRNMYVFPRDLNSNNFKGDNIAIATRAEYKEIRDALANYNGVLKLTIQGDDKFKVYFREKGLKRSRVFFDENEAKDFLREKKLQCYKLLSSFHIST